MPTVKLYSQGVVWSTSARVSRGGGKRDKAQGWTRGAVRRNRLGLMSVQPWALGSERVIEVPRDADVWIGPGGQHEAFWPEVWRVGDEIAFAITLTQRNLPATAAEYHAGLKALRKALKRRGLIRAWWIIEWQRRGHPHVHLIAYFPASARVACQPIAYADGRSLRVAALVEGATVSADEIAGLWLGIANRRGWEARRGGQHVARVDRVVGWLDYLQSHAFRGMKHYQRSGKCAPAGWLAGDGLGRVWGRWGEWPMGGPVEVFVPVPDWFQYRRRLRAWRKAEASGRARVSGLEVVQARGALRCGEGLSRVRGGTLWSGERAFPEELLQGLRYQVVEAKGR